MKKKRKKKDLIVFKYLPRMTFPLPVSPGGCVITTPHLLPHTCTPRPHITLLPALVKFLHIYFLRNIPSVTIFVYDSPNINDHSFTFTFTLLLLHSRLSSALPNIFFCVYKEAFIGQHILHSRSFQH